MSMKQRIYLRKKVYTLDGISVCLVKQRALSSESSNLIWLIRMQTAIHRSFHQKECLSILPLVNKVPSLGKDKPRTGLFHICASGLLKRKKVPLVLMHLYRESIRDDRPRLRPEDTALTEVTCLSSKEKSTFTT